MQCPYCHGEMKTGRLRVNSKFPLVWYGDDEKISGLDRGLGGIGQLTLAKYDWLGRAFIPALYCPACKKMVIETEIQR